jgi:GDPmannose 4,6-dehydratase
MPAALITGISGQDGHYLAKLLLGRGYDVVGISRNARRVAPVERLTSRNIDVTDSAALSRLFDEIAFDEVYNLAGESFGPASWERPVETARVLGVAVVELLELIRRSRHPIRFFQASSSELFGQATESPQRETTPFRPVTPYGAAKLMAHNEVAAFRDRYGIFACCGILFNHESPLRRPEFVTRKVTQAVARLRGGVTARLRLGSLDARRDWAFAGDFAEAMWRMLQAPAPDDYVLATGESHSVRELCDTAFARAGLDYRDFVDEDPELARRGDFDRIGDPSKAARLLGWRPTVSFKELVEMMVDEDVRSIGAARGEPTGC